MGLNSTFASCNVKSIDPEKWLSQGGDVSPARNRNTRLESIVRVRSTPTFQQPSLRLWSKVLESGPSRVHEAVVKALSR